MNSENTSKLLNDFTGLFYCEQFECLDGWFNIIYELSKNIYEKAKMEGITLYGDDPDYGFSVRQVKEKYGTLRYYTSIFIPWIEDLIKETEEISSKICERCGSEGKLRYKGHWCFTACEECLLRYP